MLLVQKFLKSFTFKDLAEIHGVYPSLSKNKRKISLNYDMIEAKDNDPVACECRGLILAKNDWSEFQTTPDGRIDTNIVIGDTQIVACPMFRFFNYNQGELKINLQDPNLVVEQKYDGSCLIVGMDSFKNEWCVGTRSNSEADQLIENGDHTFRQLFEKAIQDTLNLSFNEFISYLDKNKTYIFELCTPENIIVVQHSNYSIILLAVRNLSNLKEENPSNERIVKKLNCPTVQSYKLQTIEEIVQWVSGRDPTKHEGVILKDSQYNRIKIKSPSYVALSRIKDNLCASDRNIMELILSEKEDDVIPLLHLDLVNKILFMKEKFIKVLKFQDNIYLETKKYTTTKKDFAQAILVKDNVWSSALFQIFEGKADNAKDFILKSKKQGTWSNSFLDKIIEQCKKF